MECLGEFLRAKPKGAFEGKRLYLTEYPEFSHYMDTRTFTNNYQDNNTLISFIEHQAGEYIILN